MPKKSPLTTVLATQQEIDRICEKAKQQILAKVVAHIQAHPDSAFAGRPLLDLEQAIKALYSQMGVSIGRSFKEGLPKVMQEYYDRAAEDMKTDGTRRAILGKVDSATINRQLNSAFEQVAMRTDKMRFDHIRQLRLISAEVFRTATLTGASRRDVTAQLIEKALEIPGFQFVANNVRWSNQAYFKMLARTELMNAGRDSYAQKCAEEGYDLVMLTTSGKCCDACSNWEGKVFSLTGAVQGFPTKADLEAEGVFHPNCTHSYTALSDYELHKLGYNVRQPGKPDEEAERRKAEEEEARRKEKEEKRRNSWPDTPENMKVVRSLGGSTGAELVEDEYGNRFVRKHGGNAGGDAAAHLRNECAADNFYRAMGENVPENRLYETSKGPVKLSRFIEDGKSLGDWWSSASPEERTAMLEKLRPGFDLDVVSGNGDVVEMGADYILIDRDGKPWRINNGGSFGFRAQGAQKKPEEWQAGWPDDIWSMRKSSNNAPYFGQVETLDLCQSISKRDFTKALEALPEADRKIIENRLLEIRQLSDRGTPFQKDGYTPNAIDTLLHGSYDLSKEGIRERLQGVNLELGSNHLPIDYGMLRSKPTSRFGGATHDPIDSKNTEISSKVLTAVKSVNSHNAPNGDKKPNMVSVNMASNLKAELESLAQQGNQDAQYYLDAIVQIEKAAKDGTTVPTIDTTKKVYAKPTPQAPPSQADTRSFSIQVCDHIGRQSIEYDGRQVKLDPNFIAVSQGAQGDSSYSAKACKMKIARLNAMGIRPEDAEKNGYHANGPGWGEAIKTYRANPEMLARDTATYLHYQGAMQLMLENTNMPYIDRKSRTILLGRTEADDVASLYNFKPWQEAKHNRGINESHGMFRTVYVKGGNLTVARVPFSRISGCFMAEKVIDGRVVESTGFLRDGENEMTADTRGLRVLHCEKVAPHKDMKPYYDKFLEWERNGYKFP